MKRNRIVFFFILLTSLAFADAPYEIDLWNFSYWIIQESSLEVSYVKTQDTSYFSFLYTEDPIKLTSTEAKSLAEIFINNESVFSELIAQSQGEKEFKIGNNITVTLEYSQKEGRQIKMREQTDMYSSSFCRVPLKYLKALIPFLQKAEEIEQYFIEKLVFE